MQEESTKKVVEMTAEEAEKFAAFKREEERKAAIEKRKADQKAYIALVDETIKKALPNLLSISESLKDTKAQVMSDFRAALEMKEGIYGIKTDQRSHTFTNSEGTQRIIIGQYTLDAYRDTVNEGIAIVKEYIESLAKDDDSRALVKAVIRLLAKDQQGNLKASRVLQLRKMADESGNDRFVEGVRIIQDSYVPEVSKQFVRVEQKNKAGQWMSLPLGMTEA